MIATYYSEIFDSMKDRGLDCCSHYAAAKALIWEGALQAICKKASSADPKLT